MTERITCCKCGKEMMGHLYSFDSVGVCYIDEVAGDPLCDGCLDKEKRLQGEKTTKAPKAVVGPATPGAHSSAHAPMVTIVNNTDNGGN